MIGTTSNDGLLPLFFILLSRPGDGAYTFTMIRAVLLGTRETSLPVISAHQEMRDSEREAFYDDIAHVIQNTKKSHLWDSNPRSLRYTTKACGRLTIYDQLRIVLKLFVYAYYSYNRANCRSLL